MTDNSYARSSFYGLNTGTPAKQLDFDNRFIEAGEMLAEANEAAAAAKNSAGEAAGTLATLNATANAATTEIHATRDSAVDSINATEVQATQAIDALKAQADQAKTAAEQARDLSKLWATAAEGVEVEPGLASAKAGAAVATRKATEAAASADTALQHKQAADLARTDAQSARDQAQVARTDAQQARTDAQAAKTGADSAKATAVQAKTDAEAARDVAQQAAATAVGGGIPIAQKGAAGGVATLDANGKLQTAQVPAIAITSVYSCTTLAARDAITAEEGDVAVVDNDGTGNPRSYIWGGYSWKELKSALTVLSVAGKTGNVTLSVGDVSGAAPVASPSFTGSAAVSAASGDATLFLEATSLPTANFRQVRFLKPSSAGNEDKLYVRFKRLSDDTNRDIIIDAGNQTLNLFGNNVWTAGNFTPANYAALAGATFTGPARSKVQALTYAATVTPDFAQANDFTLTLGGACAFANPSNLAVGQGGCVRIQQPAGGGVTPTFSGNQWKAAGTPQWNTAANGVSLLTYKVLVSGEVIYSVGKLA